MVEPRTCKFLICGSGFAGSLLAWILAKRGMHVVLIDRGQHPRFAIGESSTPLADFLIARIADRFHLPELAPLARYGTWQQSYPLLRHGKKRGFSYFGHQPGHDFRDDSENSRSLLVTASASDDLSDTHWMRSDVDHWLYRSATEAGVEGIVNTPIDVIEKRDGRWYVHGEGPDGPRAWFADWIVDASGAAGVVPAAALAQRLDDQLLTRTGALFGHFRNVGSMTNWLRQRPGVKGDDGSDPFDADDAAQHHVLDDGWVWMLRFGGGITSVGISRTMTAWERDGLLGAEAWQATLDRYPTLNALLGEARLVDSTHAAESVVSPPRLGWIPRISRLWNQAAGDRWLALPSTVGIVDPLHSTGIAHALSGVERAADILLSAALPSELAQLCRRYSDAVIDEVRWIDQLVAVCYAALPDFELFAAACSFYFIAAIECEREMSDEGSPAFGFLGARRDEWREMVRKAYGELRSQRPRESDAARKQFLDRLRRQIAPWNSVQLLNPLLHNRYARTAAPKPSASNIEK